MYLASKIQISEEHVDVRMELWYCCILVYYFSVARPWDRPARPATVTLPAAVLLSLLVAKVRDNDAYQISGITLARASTPRGTNRPFFSYT